MSAEQAIRDYLKFLADPKSMRDETEVLRLEAAANTADDPIEKLRLLSAAQRAGEVDGAHFEQAFVANARSWANAEGVTPDAFRTVGVPPHVLAAAGLAKERPAQAKGAAKRTRSAAVSVETVTANVPDGPFSVRALMESSGASLQTVRKAVRGMLAAGELIDLGLDRDWDGRGRTPTLYQRAASQSDPYGYS